MYLFIIFKIFWVLAHKLCMLLLYSIINQVSNHKCWKKYIYLSGFIHSVLAKI